MTLKQLFVFSACLTASWLLILGILWLGGLKALAWVAGLLAFVLALVWAWRRAAFEEDRQDWQAREAHRAMVERYNRELLKRPNGRKVS